MRSFILGDEFKDKELRLVRSDKSSGFLGIEQMAQYHLSGGVSSLYADVGFLTSIGDEEMEEIPDYVLSENSQKDLESTVSTCAELLKGSKYLPDTTEISTQFGAVPEGEREGVVVRNWEDFEIEGALCEPVYTEEVLSQFNAKGECRFATALWFVVKDICEDDRILSLDWYQARIMLEYFGEYPVSPNSAYLIGELFKELCIKQGYEGDLREYYAGLEAQKTNRKRGTDATRQKAEELRSYCVALFADLAEELGVRFTLAPKEVQARELKKRALSERPGDFLRSGKPYSEEWFLTNVIEDRMLQIIDLINERAEPERP